MDVIKDQNIKQSNNSKSDKIELASFPTKDLEMRYTEPIWARVPTCSKDNYYIEVIKEGTVIDRIFLHDGSEKSYFAIGRFDPCEIKLEHPSVSRFHSVLQYGECLRGNPQWFIYDVNSTHGVRVNKNRIEKLTFVPLLAGYVFQIAASSRIFVLCGGPTEDDCAIERDIKIITKEENSKLKFENGQNSNEEDAELSNYCYYEKDPIHWLERYFEREGAPMNFRFTKSVESNDYLGLEERSKKSRVKNSTEDNGSSTWICTIELIDDVSLAGGTLVSALAPSKRLAQFQCSLLACERLDAACLLQISTLWNKRKKFAENDFYEEDEDLFYDRTGQLEEQREKRKRWCEGDFGSSQKAKTYNDLMKEHEELNEKLLVVRAEIERLNGRDSNECSKDNEEKLIQRSFSMRMAISQLKNKEKKLLEERNKTARLAEIVKPLFRGTLNKEIKESTKEKNTTSIVEECKIEDREVNELFTKEIKDEINIEVETSTLLLQNEENKKRKISNQTIKKVNEEVKKEPKFYAPSMPPKSFVSSISPRFGVLTKKELIQMKMLQCKEEGNKEALLEKRRCLLLEREEIKKRSEENEQILNNSADKYATWLPPEDQSGDGSTRLNRKFDGKY